MQPTIDELLERAFGLERAYRRATASGEEPAGRRLLITGLRVSFLEFVGLTTGVAPCRTYRWTLNLAWRNYQRARGRYLARVPGPTGLPVGTRGSL